MRKFEKKTDVCAASDFIAEQGRDIFEPDLTKSPVVYMVSQNLENRPKVLGTPPQDNKNEPLPPLPLKPRAPLFLLCMIRPFPFFGFNGYLMILPVLESIAPECTECFRSTLSRLAGS